MSVQISHYLNRPEYIFQPKRILSRLLALHNEGRESDIRLPWGAKLLLTQGNEDGIIGALRAYGVYDLGVTEILWRLIESGEQVVDVGANIGYMSSIMAAKVGSAGKVHSFEPNPEVYDELANNVQEWQEALGWNFIYLYKMALSDHSGTGTLHHVPGNRGEAFITTDEYDSKNAEQPNSSQEYGVPLVRLDQIFGMQDAPEVIKIDVEGHELSVLRGASQLLAANKIRDIIFEEHQAYPTETTDFLEEQNYSIYRIYKGLWGPQLRDAQKLHHHPWEPANYLATLNPERALKLIRPRGWYCLNTSQTSSLSQ